MEGGKQKKETSNEKKSAAKLQGSDREWKSWPSVNNIFFSNFSLNGTSGALFKRKFIVPQFLRVKKSVIVS